MRSDFTTVADHGILLDFVASVSELMLSPIERSGRVETWMIGDTGFPKKGRHSVGMNRQYCAQLRLFRDQPLMRITDASRQ